MTRRAQVHPPSSSPAGGAAILSALVVVTSPAEPPVTIIKARPESPEDFNPETTVQCETHQHVVVAL